MKGSKWGPIGGISILGCMVPTSCGAGSGKDQGILGSKGEQTGSEGEQREQTGSQGSEQGVKGSKGSECISILGFRVPTTCGRKKFSDHLQCMSVPTTWN